MNARDLSVVLVAHRSSRLIAGAVGAVRREAAAAGLSTEVIVVEQSEDPAEAERAFASGPDLMLVRANRGYAAGLNAGIAAASGRWLVAANPDVELAEGALAPLVAALATGWDVVGPQLELAGFLFPPADVQTPVAEARRRLALRGRRSWERHLRRELRRWRVVWESVTPRPVPALSGALLAFPATLSARLGPWDEGFFLYFEETDWLRRARRAGAAVAVVPAARAAHRWGHAARPEAFAERFAASQRRFYRLWFPLLGALALRLPAERAQSPWPWEKAPIGQGWRWLLSPSPVGFPAALFAGHGPVRSAAADFCRACERPRVTLVAWHAKEGRIAGPFAWPAEDATPVEGGREP